MKRSSTAGSSGPAGMSATVQLDTRPEPRGPRGRAGGRRLAVGRSGHLRPASPVSAGHLPPAGHPLRPVDEGRADDRGLWDVWLGKFEWVLRTRTGGRPRRISTDFEPPRVVEWLPTDAGDGPTVRRPATAHRGMGPDRFGSPNPGRLNQPVRPGEPAPPDPRPILVSGSGGYSGAGSRLDFAYQTFSKLVNYVLTQPSYSSHVHVSSPGSFLRPARRDTTRAFPTPSLESHRGRHPRTDPRTRR